MFKLIDRTIVVALLLMFLLTWPGWAESNVWHVEKLPDKLERGATYVISSSEHSGYVFDDEPDGKKIITILANDITGTTFKGQLRFESDYYTIKNFTIDPVAKNDCVYLWGANHFTMENCELIGIGRDNTSKMNCFEQVWNGTVGRPSGNNLTLRNNIFRDSSKSCIVTRHPTNVIFDNNIVARNWSNWSLPGSTKLQHSEGWSNHGGYNILVTNNQFIDMMGTAAFATLDATITSVVFRNNVFDGIDCGNGAVVTTRDGAKDFIVINNTFYNSKRGRCGVEFAKSGTGGGNNIITKNVWFDCPGSITLWGERFDNAFINSDLNSRHPSPSGSGETFVADSILWSPITYEITDPRIRERGWGHVPFKPEPPVEPPEPPIDPPVPKKGKILMFYDNGDIKLVDFP